MDIYSIAVYTDISHGKSICTNMLQKLKKMSLIWFHARPASTSIQAYLPILRKIIMSHDVLFFKVYSDFFYLQNGCANKISHTIRHIVWYPTNNYVNQSKSDADIIQLNCNLTPEEMQKNVYVINTKTHIKYRRKKGIWK